ncbi:MAG TPA: FAD-dependent oxidoreductase [Candidatus Saccharimonadales bacterium]|nr:FAD-dependent oxidoreductase [Candidatus Saccharimonadales bacterium]
MNPVRVVVVGGGFAAVQFAKTLRSKLRASECDILLFSRENHMVFHPLLADVAGASINGDAAAAPLRQMLPGVECRTERVQRISLSSSEIEFDDGNGALTRLHYDHVVVACGAESNLGIIPGMSDHAFAFKVMRDAVELRQQIVRQMESAEAATDPNLRRWHLSFIIVGAGFSGVEVAGEINELVRSSTRFYQNFRKEDVLVSMVHSQDQILPEVAPKLREFARKKMEKAGITMVLNTRAVAATHEGVELNDGRMLRGATIVCTIGTATSPIVQALDVPKERGRIRTTPEMRIEGQTNAWAIGDCAYIINAFDNKPAAPTGQFAERQGRQAALNVVRLLKAEPTQPFRFKALGQLCSIGGYQAVAEMLGVHISGFVAWLLWRGVYLFKLPTWSRRIKVGLDWSWDVLFPRDLSFLNTDTTQQATHAYYRPGDFIHRQGEPARVFSIIEEGQVEVLQKDSQTSDTKVVAVLGKGDFFGEGALLGNRPHETSIRARSAVRLRQIGSTLFSELAGSFAPLRDLLAKAVTSHSGDFWRRLPISKSILEGESLASLLDPLPAELLRKETRYADAITALNESATGHLLVVDEKQRLWGTLDRNDLYQIIARIVLTQPDGREGVGERRLADLLPANPIYVALEDSLLVASATMLDHGISWLPVVKSKDDPRPVGRLRGDRITRRLIEKMAQVEPPKAQVAS